MPFIDLSCPGCGAPLSASASIRIYVCEACSTTSTPLAPNNSPGSSSSLWVPPRRLLRPRLDLPAQGRILLLPLWVIPLQERESCPKLPPELRIPAVGRAAFGRLVDSARRLSRSEHSLEEFPAAQERPIPRPPQGELEVEEAFAVAEIVALGQVEGWPADDQIASWQPSFGAIRLVDLPLQEVRGGLMDLVFGLTVDSALQRSLEPIDARGRFHRELVDSPA